MQQYIIGNWKMNGGQLYYVHSGLYNDYGTALQAASQFTSQNIPGAMVVKVSSNQQDSL